MHPFHYFIFFLIAMNSSFSLMGAEKPLHEVASLGAATTGALVEGKVGSMRKSYRQRFYCQSSGPKPGFLGPEVVAKPTSIKDQPGIFPAPLMGLDSLTFTFTCQNQDLTLTPVIIKPDGTAVYGQPMKKQETQTVMISSPAQTGIYTLFALAHQTSSNLACLHVKATTSTHPEQVQSFRLEPFIGSQKESDHISAEFIYISNKD